MGLAREKRGSLSVTHIPLGASLFLGLAYRAGRIVNLILLVAAEFSDSETTIEARIR